MKLIARSRHIEDYNEGESVEIENNFGNARIRKVTEDFNELRDRFLKWKIKEIRRNFCATENK